MENLGNRAKLIAVAVLALILVAAGIWYWQRNRLTAPPTLGSELLEKARNPLKDEVPETNPFKKVETNPFKEAESNPFIGTYENPFD